MEITDKLVENGEEKIKVLSITGEIDLYNAPDFEEVVKKCIYDKVYKIVVNLDKADYIDSSGINALISSLSNLKKYNGDLFISNLTNSSMRKIFSLTKVNTFFCIYWTEDDAVRCIKTGKYDRSDEGVDTL